MHELVRHGWVSVVSPVSGATLLAGGFTFGWRPFLEGPAWLLDGATIVLGAAGLIMGGIAGAPLLSMPARGLNTSLVLRTLAVLAVAVAPILLATGTPVSTPAAVVLATAAAVLLTPSICRKLLERR